MLCKRCEKLELALTYPQEIGSGFSEIELYKLDQNEHEN